MNDVTIIPGQALNPLFQEWSEFIVNSVHGTIWRNGVGVPPDTLGLDSDYYLDTTTGNVFIRAHGGYGLLTNILGPAGLAGAQGPATSVANIIPLQLTDGTTVTVDLTLGDRFSLVLGGNRTLSVTNTNNVGSFILVLQQDGSGSHTVTWFPGVLWSNGLTPSLTTTAGKRDVFSFMYLGSGIYLGFVAGQNM